MKLLRFARTLGGYSHKNGTIQDKAFETVQIGSIKKIVGHLHFEGSVPTSYLARTAAKNELAAHSSLLKAYRPMRFRSFLEFARLIVISAHALRTEEDFFFACQYVGQRLQRENVLYAEVIWVPQLYLRHTIGLNAILRALNASRDRILDTHGIEIRWIVDFVRGYPNQGAHVLEWLTSIDPRSCNIVAVGLGGDESHSLKEMRDLLRATRKLGLAVYPHAGEQKGPASVVEVIEELEPQRIAHGIRAAESDEVLRLIRSQNIHLDICPTSNCALGLYEKIKYLPINTLIEAKCAFSINTDDPALFGVNMNVELEACMQAHDLTSDFVQAMYRQAVDVTFLSNEEKEHLRRRMSR